VEDRDFLYNYTNIFFSEIVKETILIENWEETDFDHRYVEYADVFLKIRDKCFVQGGTDEGITDILTHHKDHIVKLFNRKMGKHFKNEFDKSGVDNSGVDNKEGNRMPKDIFFHDRINSDALKIFRDFEEKHLIYTQGKTK
jgi:hypothetical protein